MVGSCILGRIVVAYLCFDMILCNSRSLNMNFLIAQAMGIFSTVAAICCVQARTAGFILLGQFLANAFSGISYGLLGSLSGAWVCILAAVHSMLISVVNKLEDYRRKKWVTAISAVFSVAYVAGSVLTYAQWPDIISCICALLFVVTIAQRDAGKMRNVMLISMSLWVIFDIAMGAYTNITTHASTILSILTAKFRLDRKNKNT